MINRTFHERVRDEAIANSRLYERDFVNKEYLICSNALKDNKYFIIRCEKENFKHLIGVNTELSALDFYNKCILGTLDTVDFNFIKKGHTEKEVKGSTRQKIMVLADMMTMFEDEVFIQENLQKNKISCAIGTQSKSCTVGFISSGRPKTLLKGNELDGNKACVAELIMRKSKDEKYFTHIVHGDEHTYEGYYQNIKGLVS